MANMTFKASLLPSADNTYSLGSNDIDTKRWKINGFAGQPIEYIEGTQTEATGSWTGVTQDSELKEGKVIAYRLPYAGSGNASLTLTFTKPTGDANSGAIPVYAGNTRLTTHYPVNSIMIMVYDGINWRTNPYYNTNTNTLLRTYTGSANYEYPLLAQNSAANATAAWTEYTSSYKDYYGVIPNSSTTRATINLSTGHITVPGGITANLTGTASKATADGDGNNIVNTYATKASLEALDINSPNSSGSTLQFIDTISQTNGKISATKKQVQNATSEQAGVVSTDTQTFSGDKTFNGLITTSHSATHKGIKVGDTYINASNGDLILQNNNAIRFGTDTWDYKEWAGLKYVHSTKTISLGLADGTIFTTSSGNEQANGILNFPGIDKLVLTQNSGGLYKYYSSASTAPFLQVNSNNIDVSILKIDGNSPTDIRDSQSYGFNLKYIGTGDGANNTLRIYGDNSDGVDALATEWSGDGKVGISGTYNTDYNLYVHGTSYHNGNDTHAGNINPEATNTRSLGETDKRWSHLYIGTKDTYGSNVRPIWWNGGVPTEISYTANRLYYPSAAEAFTAGTHFVSDTKIAINSTNIPDETLYVNGTEKIADALSINADIDTNYKLYVNGDTKISSKLSINTDVDTNYRLKVNGDSSLDGTTCTRRLELRRSESINYGRIGFYAPSYVTWVDYMSNIADGAAPNGSTPSTLGTVTTWARRSLIENSATYGWIWESSTNAANSTITAQMALNASTGNLYIRGNCYTSSGSIYIGTSGDTAAERDLDVLSGAGGIRIFSHAATDGSRGIWLHAHGTGAAKAAMTADTNNNINFYGTFNGNATTATKLSNTPNNTTTFLRGDNTWSNTLASTLTTNGLVVNAQNTTSEGGEIKLVAAPSSGYEACLDVLNQYFRIHSKGSERFKVDLSSGAIVVGTIGWGSITGKPSTFTPASHSHSYLPLSGGTMTGAINFNSRGACSIYNGPNDQGGSLGGTLSNVVINSWYGVSFTTTCTGQTYTGKTAFYINCRNGYAGCNRMYGAVWNDYAEMRNVPEAQNELSKIKPGMCVQEVGDDTMIITTERLQRGCKIISDTYGFNIGETEDCKTPIAVSGRALVYLYESREEAKSHIGWPVCSGPNGTVSIMSEEEEMKYPSRIIGTISAIPDYQEWGTEKVKIDGRIWIYIK